MFKFPKFNARLILIASLILGVWLLGIQRSNAQLSLPGRNIQEVVTKLNQTVDNFTGKINEYEQKITTYETKIDQYDQKVNTTITSLESKIQTQINSITGQVQTEIQTITTRVQDEIRGIQGTIETSIEEIESRITKSITALSWGLLIGDGFVSALFSGLATWWVTRRLQRTVKVQLEELNETFKTGVNQVVNTGEAAAQSVTDSVNQSNVFSVIQELRTENQRIIQLLNDLRQP